jgi:excisionase family DNA binding protein
MNDYMSFEEVAKELAIDEETLKRMVADGEIRAFRSEGNTVFKREDVERLEAAMASEPIIVPPGGEEAEALSEDELETVLNMEDLGEIDLGKELEGAPKAAKEPKKPEKPTKEEEETFVVVEEGEETKRVADTVTGATPPTDTISLEEEETAVESDTFVLSEEDIGDETESLELLGETSTVIEGEKEAAPTAREAAAAGFVQGEAYPRAAAKADPVLVGLMVLTIAVMAIGLFGCLALVTGQSNPLLGLFIGK